MIGHYCGLFAVAGHEDAARLAYFALFAQQHRGQESAGIASWDGKHLYEQRGVGLVSDVFTEERLAALKGDTAIGHVRYATPLFGSDAEKKQVGSSFLRNAQPFVIHFQHQELAVAHNGSLVNAGELRDRLEKRGSIFHATSDTEVFMQLLVIEMRDKSLEDAVIAACRHLKGAYSFVLMAGRKVIALRDPHGFRPLSIGRMEDGGSYVFASETSAFDLLEADFLRSVEPGEMVVVEDGELCSYRLLPEEDMPPRRQCIFELVYFARPDSLIFDEQVYLCRKRMGWQLAAENTPNVDFVMPFPDSGVYCAVGFAQCAELPYEHAMIRNHYIGRTFIQPSQSMRNFSVRVKINPVRAMIEGKRICIVDDSIVRGTTMRVRVQKLRDMGAREVHVRISCPPVKYPCFYGVDFHSPRELVAHQYDSVQKIADHLGLDSLYYLSLEGMLRAVSHSDHYCTACFTGEYPVLSDSCRCHLQD